MPDRAPSEVADSIDWGVSEHTDELGWLRPTTDEGTSYAARLRVSEDRVVLEDHYVPRVVEFRTDNEGEPEVFARVEVDQAGPKLVELRFTSTDPDSRGIRQGDLRDTEVKALAEDLVAGFTFRVEYDETGEVILHLPFAETPAYLESRRFLGRVRSGRREITPQMLERVAQVYRDNIAGHPTKAVQHHFQVSQRMAAEYVSRARQRGLLPPTKQGKKQA